MVTSGSSTGICLDLLALVSMFLRVLQSGFGRGHFRQYCRRGMMQRAAYRTGKAFVQVFCKDPCLCGEELIIECPVILSGLLRLPVLF